MLAVEANIESWQDFRTAEKNFLFSITRKREFSS